MPEWRIYDGLHTLLGAPIDDFTCPTTIPASAFARWGACSPPAPLNWRWSRPGLSDAILSNGETTLFGSSTGSTAAPMSEFATMLTEKHTNNITATTYVQMMPHTTAVNTGLFLACAAA